MIRNDFIEQVLRQTFGELPDDDSSITYNLVNQFVNQGVALAAKECYKESLQIDGVAYVNNSFYTTFSGIAIAADVEDFLYKATLPQIPLGIGRNEGIATVQFVNSAGLVSYPGIPLSVNQVGYRKGIRPIPNKIMYWAEGGFLYAESTLPLFTYTAKIRMISAENTDLNTNLNVPSEYLPLVLEYCSKALLQERNLPKEMVPDGIKP